MTELINNHINNFKNYTNNHFEFSIFQNDAINGILNNNHVLITAHTGSGKTLPAEFAIYYYTKILKKKVIYTSPIKALSNQKYKEFLSKFNDIEIGILTGDIKHNPTADVLIMTTEILQNNCFKRHNQGKYLDFNLDIENDLGCVIFDEVHYIDDPDRGTVWEQTMIMLPNHIPFVMLSATIGQKEIFAKWIENIKQKQVIICHNDERVVPLTFYEYFDIPNKYVSNIKDKTKKQMFENKLSSKLNIIKQKKEFNMKHLHNTKKCLKEIDKDGFIVHKKYVINECLTYLKNNDMFPCLFFVFSRKQVENIAKQITSPLFLENEKDYMVEPIFRDLLVKKLNNWKEYIALPEYSFYLNLLEKGIGVHHAGMLPVFREIMEILYEKKYIKALIATETFAIGLNMPTRTTVFTSLYKHDGVQLRALKSHEFTQMAGRAGRRNIDKVGHVILLTNCYDPLTEQEYYNLLFSGPKILSSKFRITYNLLLNYINNYTKEDFKCMIQKSLMNLDIENVYNRSINNIKTLNENIKNIEDKIKNLDYDFYTFFEKILSLEEKIRISKNKQKKSFQKQLNEITYDNKNKLQDKTLLIKKNELQKELLNEEETKLYCETYIDNQINTIYGILNQNLFVDDEFKLTESGLSASYIHELPCLVFYDLYYYYNKFETFDEDDILSLLSCFYEIKIKDTIKIITPPFLKNELKYTQERINYYSDMELKNEMYITTNINLQFDLMEKMKEWYNNINNVEDGLVFFNTIKNEKDIFIGDFIKCCLKIINMINELKIVCENEQNYSLLVKLNNIQSKIQKNIVSNKSLYL